MPIPSSPRRLNRGLTSALVLTAALLAGASAPAQTAGGPARILWGAFDGGGGVAQSSGHVLGGSAIGQGAVGRSSNAGRVVVWGVGRSQALSYLDWDGDGLNYATEAALGTDTRLVDSDGDGLSDFAEVNVDGDPGSYRVGVDTDPNNPDTDGDGVPDGIDPEPLVPVAQVPALPPAMVVLLALLLAAILGRRRRPRGVFDSA